jgi:hypothetical protein
VNVDAHRGEQPRDFGDIVPVPEAERSRPEQIGFRPDAFGARRALRSGRRRMRRAERAHELVEGLRRAPVLFLLIGGQL